METRIINQNPGTIFMQPWWLDVVAPGQWNDILVKKNDEIIARMPYHFKKKWGFNIITMPPLTQHLGPWIKNESNSKNKISTNHQLMNELLHQLPKYDYYFQRFSSDITDWLPFYWKKYNQTTYYTYTINDISEIETVWSNFQKTTRYEIRKARKILSVQDTDIETLYKINTLTFNRQGMKNPHSYELIQKLYLECSKRNACKIFQASDSFNKVHAVLFLVWDNESAYYLIGGADPQLRKSSASSLLLWEAIQFASTVVNKFDFEGSMVPGIEKFFRSFGTEQKPYFKITKINHPLIKIARDVKYWIRK